MRASSYPSLESSSVFITGGATGIGAALVKAFAQQGARVAFIDIDSASARDLCNEVEAAGAARPWFETVDVTDVEQLQAAIHKAAGVAGGLRVLVNNVANDNRHRPEQVTPAQWRNCMAVNLDAAFFASQTAYELMKNGGGSIINFGSINALLGPGNMPGYVTAKAGVMGLTKALAADFGPARVRVNSILPGWVVTKRQLECWLTPEEEAKWMQQVALPDRLLPEDVANAALFLASDASRMITSQHIVVDAGRT